MIKFNIWANEQGQWFWHATSRNGKVLADGSEGYTRKASAERAAVSFAALVQDGPVEFNTLDADPAVVRAEKKAAKANGKVPAKKRVAKAK